MPSKIEIEYSAAVAGAVADIEKVNTAVGQTAPASEAAGLSLTDLKSGLDLAVGAFKAVKGAAEAVINPTVEYAGQVRELGRTIGSTAEESSKLIQAADDVGISAGTLQGALQAAIRKGVKPTIEGIGELADEYNAIQDPIERTKFLMDNFGRSGAALAPLMEQGAAGIKAAGDAAEQAGLVMSQDAVDGARQYEIAVDNLDDSLLALKITAAEKVLPAVIALTDAMTTQISLTRTWDEAQQLGIVTGEDWAVTHHAIAAGLLTEADVQARLTTEIANYKQGLVEVDPAVQNMRLAQDDLTGAADRASVAIQSQDQWLADLASVITNTTTPATYGYLTASDLLKEGLSGVTEQLIFQKAAANLDEEAALSLGIAMGVVDSRALLLNESLPALKEKYDANHDGAISAAEAASGYSAAVQALSDAILALPKQTDISVDTYFNTHGTPPSNYGAPAGPPAQTGTNADARASGGPVYGGTPYMVGEQGPEIFLPNSNGSIVDANLTKRLVAALEGLVARGGQQVTNIYGYGQTGDGGNEARALAGALA